MIYHLRLNKPSHIIPTNADIFNCRQKFKFCTDEIVHDAALEHASLVMNMKNLHSYGVQHKNSEKSQ